MRQPDTNRTLNPEDDLYGVFTDASAALCSSTNGTIDPMFVPVFAAAQHKFNREVLAKPCKGILTRHGDNDNICGHPLCPSCWVRRETRIRAAIVEYEVPRWVIRHTEWSYVRDFDTPAGRELRRVFIARDIRSLKPVAWTLEIKEIDEHLDIVLPKYWEIGYRYIGVFEDTGATRYRISDPHNTGARMTPTHDPLTDEEFNTVYTDPGEGPGALEEWRQGYPYTPFPLCIDIDRAYDLTEIGKKKNIKWGNKFFTRPQLQQIATRQDSSEPDSELQQII